MKKLISVLLLMLSGALLFAAGESLCASVKIEIRQELTLERQAFDANMKINNGLDKISLEDVKVEVNFTDKEGNPVVASSNPNDVNAKFFIRIDRMENITNVNGSGVVAPSSIADIHWLIIPSPGAANGSPLGTLYYVGATLTYRIGADSHTTVVTPDNIMVKPLPELELDYFLPEDVYGDDPFTGEIEPEVPFNLGVRVKNSGFGAAHNLKIDSAQPKIVENKLGLLVGFVIDGSEVDGVTKDGSLLADFGNIEPNKAGTARWIMRASLSGRFTEFAASFSHADELGGKMTSLIKDPINTHFLVRDVLVDLPGRDSVRDFLAKDGAGYKVYESDSTDTVVTDQSSSSALAYVSKVGSEEEYTLTVPPSAGFIYTKLKDPFSGSKVIKEVFNQDGKRLKLDNVWFSKSKNKDTKKWQYYFNLFDINGGGSYRVIFEDNALIPQPPVMQFIPDRTVLVGNRLGFIIEASDPNSEPITISSDQLPVGATITAKSEGVAEFEWTPAAGQEGSFTISFKASDGTMSSERKCTITVYSDTDSDGDGLPDNWEMQHFSSLERDGKGDYDRDGHSDLAEFGSSTNPLIINAPTVPQIMLPLPQGESNSFYPLLKVKNSMTPAGDSMSYIFELYSDKAFSQLLFSKEMAEYPDHTSLLTGAIAGLTLEENRDYYWRVRANDGSGKSRWAYGSFFVNTVNEAPQGIGLSYPAEGSEVDSLTPYLEVGSALDGDNDKLLYSFQIYEDAALTRPVDSTTDVAGTTGTTGWQTGKKLVGGETYYWQASAADEHGAVVTMPAASFRVNTLNRAPLAPELDSPQAGSDALSKDVTLTVKRALDGDYEPLVYHFEVDKTENFSSAAKIESPAVAGAGDKISWTATGLTEDTLYYWRARAFDGKAYSRWVSGSFTLDVQNELPSAPVLANPSKGAWVQTLKPELAVIAPFDVDDESFDYTFQVYSDAGMSNIVHSQSSKLPEITLNRSLSNFKWFYWRVQAKDSRGALTPWSAKGAFYTLVSNTAPIVRFTFSNSTPYSGETVIFDASDSTDDTGIASYSWDLNGDGNFADAYGISVQHIFPKAGRYLVALQVTDDGGMTAETAITIAVANRAPEAAFSYNPAPAYSGDEITFDATTSKDSDGTIKSYLWDLDGDGTYGEALGKVVKHNFKKSGSYQVGLQVFDDNGDSNKLIKTVIIDNRKPVIAINYSPAQIYTGQEITFNATDSTDDGTIVSYSWDLDNDGVFGDKTGALVKHSFATLGSYPVSLQITDDNGATVKGGLTIEVKNRLPQAKLTYGPLPVLPGSTVTFDSSGSTDPDGAIKSMSWDLDGDNLFNEGTTATVTKSFTVKGNYRVGVKLVDNDGGVTTHYETVAVVDNSVPPVTALTISGEGDNAYLSWTNPAHTWEGVKVLRKQGTYSDNTNDGIVVFDGQAGFCSDKVAAAGDYFYTVYSYDFYGRFGSGVNGQVTLPTATKNRFISFRNGDGSAYSTMHSVNSWQGDSFNRVDSSEVTLGVDEAAKKHDLWLYLPNMIGADLGQIASAGSIKTATLSLKVKDFKGVEGESYRIKVYSITDPDNLGAPVYPAESGFRAGLNYNYRDNRLGMAVKWDNSSDSLGQLLSSTTALDTAEFTVDKTVATVKLNIKKALESWMAGNVNQGLYITLETDGKNVGRLLMHGVNALNSADRPKLDVLFTEQATSVSLPPVDSIKATAYDSGVTVELTKPAIASIEGVKVVRQQGHLPADIFDGSLVYDGNAASFRDMAVTNGKTYYYAAFTYDKDRNYGPKKWGKAVPGTVSAATLTATAGAEHVALSWPKATGADLYRVYRIEGTASPILISQQTEAGYLDYNVDAKEYTYYITAINSFGEGSESNRVAATVASVTNRPAAPTAINAVVLSGSLVELSWTNSSTNATSYVVERKTGTDGLWTAINTLPFYTTKTVDDGIMPSSSYSYRLKAVNSAGESAYSSETNITVEALPLPVSSLNWQVISTASIRVNWASPAANVDSYRVELYSRAGELVRTENLNKGTTTHFVNRLMANTDYLIKVVTVNSSGEAVAQTALINTGSDMDIDIW